MPPLKFPAEDAACGGGFVDDDLAEPGAIGLQFFPKPRSHVLDGGIFEAGGFVEIGVVELVDERVHGPADLCVIVDPADFGIYLAFDGDLNPEAVAMHLFTFVIAGEVGQGLGGFEAEFFDESGAHSGNWGGGVNGDCNFNRAGRGRK